MSHEDQVYELKTAEFAADGDECVRRDDAARIARAADAEIAKLRAENARLDRLTWDYRGELDQAQEEIALLRAENAALQNEARQIWAQIPDEYKLSSGERSPEATRLMVKGLWAMSEELRALRAENASLDRIATDYYERLTGEAQEEIARLRSGIATLREQWQARHDAWKSEFDEETQKSQRAERSLILAGQRYAMACVLLETWKRHDPRFYQERLAPTVRRWPDLPVE